MQTKTSSIKSSLSHIRVLKQVASFEMESSSLHLFTSMLILFFLFSSFHLILTNSSSSPQPRCHDHESSALLQFKRSLLVRKFASGDPSAYPKVLSWKKPEGESSDCCEWDGVECDESSGHVIGLDLSSSFLYGSIDSNSSLFHLGHLQRLNLAYNDFNFSQIPAEIGELSSLTNLNLSSSVFFGQIPAEISKLSKLASLDLSYNADPLSSESLLKLEKPNLRSLVQKLTGLEELRLSNVNIYSPVPDLLANFSSLKSLSLGECRLYGEFPAGIFNLPRLQVLNVRLNPNLTGYMPEFHQNNSLRYLGLAGSSFHGRLPDSIQNLHSLNELDLGKCKFSGSLPASIGSLNQLTTLNLSFNYFGGQIPYSLANLSRVTCLDFKSNNFSGTMAPWVGKLTSLAGLYLNSNSLYGEIPHSLANLTQLVYLALQSNQLTGEIPTLLTNLTLLSWLDLSHNYLQGQIRSSFISELGNLVLLYLGSNSFSGTSLELDTFVRLKYLAFLSLSDLLFISSSTSVNNTSARVSKFRILALSSCNLTKFPDFLRSQDQLVYLRLDNNNLRGEIPTWFWNASRETLQFLDLSGNFLTSFEQNPIALPWAGLRIFDLSNNMLVGSLPIPPVSTLAYQLENNRLTGEVPQEICHANSLFMLNLSNNSLSGRIPQCLGSFSNSLAILNLKGNNFLGTLPSAFAEGSKLRMIDLSQNQLEGNIPTSLAKCVMLEFLDLSHNHMHDIFPSWLGALPELQVLILKSNQLYGTIGEPPHSDVQFPKLHIIDMSQNHFTGRLPSIMYFHNMKNDSQGKMETMEAKIDYPILSGFDSCFYPYSMTIITKGLLLPYQKILDGLTTIDLSGNKFTGEIPKSIGNLKGLQSLNLSNNDLTDSIPVSLENLTNLDSLDLSQNEISGEIPQQLELLTFLGTFNVSYNNLTGPIPRGRHLDTFQNNSYEGNPGLCGEPLSKKCASSVAPTPEQEKDTDFQDDFEWIFVIAGCVSGLVVGLVIGHILTSRNHEWFVETFGRKQRRPRKQPKRRQEH